MIKIKTIEIEYNHWLEGKCKTIASIHETGQTVGYSDSVCVYSVSIPKYGISFVEYYYNNIKQVAKALIEAHLNPNKPK